MFFVLFSFFAGKSKTFDPIFGKGSTRNTTFSVAVCWLRLYTACHVQINEVFCEIVWVLFLKWRKCGTFMKSFAPKSSQFTENGRGNRVTFYSVFVGELFNFNHLIHLLSIAIRKSIYLENSICVRIKFHLHLMQFTNAASTQIIKSSIQIMLIQYFTCLSNAIKLPLSIHFYGCRSMYLFSFYLYGPWKGVAPLECEDMFYIAYV